MNFTIGYKVRWWISTIILALTNVAILFSLQTDPLLVFGFVTNSLIISTLWTARPILTEKKREETK